MADEVPFDETAVLPNKPGDPQETVVSGSVDALVSGEIDAMASGEIDAAVSGEIDAAVTGTIDLEVSGEIVCIRRYEGPYYPDSIEYGTPSKGGAVKVYGNLDDTTTFETRLRAAMALRALAQALADPEG